MGDEEQPSVTGRLLRDLHSMHRDLVGGMAGARARDTADTAHTAGDTTLDTDNPEVNQCEIKLHIVNTENLRAIRA